MAKARYDEQLFELLRAGGLRKRAARIISEASGAGRGAGGQVEKRARAALTDLRSLVEEANDRVNGGPGKRQAAAQKAARTRAAAARKRSATAKKAAKTRAKGASGTTRAKSASSKPRAKAASGTTRARAAAKTTTSRAKTAAKSTRSRAKSAAGTTRSRAAGTRRSS